MPQRILGFGLALIVLLVAPSLVVAQNRPPRLELKTNQLKNGLKIVMLEDHSVPVINLQVWYHVGAKDERPGRTGFAHLFEHMMFKGSAHIGPNEYSKMIREIGGEVNAYTSFDQTVYWQTFPSNYLDRVMWMEAERMHTLKVDEANFKSEREVVKEERRERYENQPYGNLLELIIKNAFEGQPYSHLPIGSMEDLNQASLADVKDFYETFYQPNNATLVIVGDFTPAEAVQLAEKHFGKIPASAKPIPRLPHKATTATSEKRVIEYDPKIQLPAIVQAYQIPQEKSPDKYALEIAANILSAGQSSRLYQDLVYQKQIALAAQGQALFFENNSLFFTFAIMGMGHKPEAGESAINAIIAELQTKPVEAKELEKAKNQIVSGLIFGRQTDQQKGDAIGYAAVMRGDPHDVNEEVEKYLAVTAADVQRVMKQYFTPQNRVVVTMLPASQKPAGSDK